MVGGNAAAALRLRPRRLLAPVAARVGPTVAEICRTASTRSLRVPSSCPTAFAPAPIGPKPESWEHSMSRYLVISADCHAGLPNEQYREYLDPAVPRRVRRRRCVEREPLEAEMRGRGLRNEEFAEEWYAREREGSRGGWDAARRDKELDADGVAGEVIFPDADAVPRARRRRSVPASGESGDVDPELLLAGRPRPQPLAGRAVRRQPRPPGRRRDRPDPRTTSTPRSPRSAGRASPASAAGS